MAEGFAPLILELRAKGSELFSELKKAKSATKDLADETGKTSKVSASHFDKMAGAGKAMAFGIVGVGAVVGGAALKMGMDFQESMTTLVTGAGESEKNIGMVGDGILAMSGKVGQSSSALASGMYLIESAGFHGAAGLKVLQAAAEGAKVGNADMKTVADGVTTALSDYGLKASDAATVTSKLVETVASGKTNMGDLAGALATVLPVASTAKVGLDQILGAMATMTAKGTPAADAATYLKQTIAQLSNPTSKAAGEMKALGLSAIDISSNLGKRGLTGTMDVLTSAIQSKMGPAGTVLIEHLKNAAKSGKGFQSVLSQLPPTQQTYVAALADMVGGSKSMQAALMLTGDSAATFKDNVKNIGAASTEAGGHVKGFAETQKDLKTKLENAKDGVAAMVTKLGMELIPVVTVVMDKMTAFGSWLVGHKAVLITFAGIIGSVVVVAITAYIASLVKAQVETVAKLALMVAGWFGYAAESSAAAAESAAATESSVIGQFATMIGAAVSGFASMVAAGAVWVAQTAAQMVRAIASGAVWIAQHVAMAAVAVVQYGIMAGAALAAFVAENLATLGIIAGIALVIAAIVFLATHWTQVWQVICDAAKWAYDNVIAPVGRWIVGNVIHPIVAAAEWYLGVWLSVWNAVGSAASWVYGRVISPLVGGIRGVFSGIVSALSWLSGVWSSIWSGIGSALQWVYDHTIGPIVSTIKGAISTVSGAVNGVGSVASSVGHFLGFANGGVIPGAPGEPRLIVGHGGEVVLSRDMLAGKQKPPDEMLRATSNAHGYTSTSAAALNGSSSGGLGGGQTVNVYAQTNADPHRIAAEAGWALRRLA